MSLVALPSEVVIGRPHSFEQSVLFRPPSIVNVADAGTKFGKSLGCLGWLCGRALENPGAICRWISTSYAQARMVYRIARRWFRAPIATAKESTLEIVFLNGATIQFKTAERPELLEGEAVNFWVFDEAGKAREEAWFAHLSTITQTQGPGWAISTPNGRNWFWRLAQYAIDGKPGHSFFTFPTTANPTIPRAMLRQHFATLPRRVFEQRFLGIFHDDAGGFFLGVQDIVAPYAPFGPRAGCHYVIGADVAKHHDFTVLTVMEHETKRLAALDRWQRLEWGLTWDRIATLARLYQAEVVLDATGIGDPSYDELVARGINVTPFRITPQNKGVLVQTLAQEIEHRRILIPPLDVLVNELTAFEVSLTRHGNLIYGAPAGLHDDCAMALALACWGLKGYRPIVHVAIDPEPSRRAFARHGLFG